MAPYLHCVKEEGVIEELAKAIRRQRCALLIGLRLADIDEELLQKNPEEYLSRMEQWCVENNLMTRKEGEDDLKKPLEADVLKRVTLITEEYLTETDQRQQCINEVLLQNPDEIRYIYRLLARMSFRVYLTTGYEQFLEKASEEVETPLLKYDKDSIEDALVAYQAEESFILKLHGDVAKDNPGVITLSNGSASSRPSKPIFYPPQVRELLANTDALFVGFETVDADFKGFKRAVNKKDELKRWLLVPADNINEEQAEQLWIEDKITTLSYADRTELVPLLEKLAAPQQIEIYVSYAPEDNEMRNRLQKHLSVMKYPGLKIDWSDGKIDPGLEPKRVIEERLKKAQIILLLVSVDYLASIGNIKTEMTRAVQRHRRGEARVIPIIFRSCDWKDHPFGRLAALPSDEIPIDLASNIDRILLEVARKIKTAIKEWVDQH